MDTCFALSLEAHWTCSDEVKKSEASRQHCTAESAKYEKIMDVRWTREGEGVTSVKRKRLAAHMKSTLKTTNT